MHARADRVRQAMEEARSIHEAAESMTKTQETATLHSFGFTDDNPSSTSSDKPVTSDESDFEPSVSPRRAAECDIADSELLDLVRASSFNWFEVIDHLATNSRIDQASVEQKYEALLCQLTPKEQGLMKQSHNAYLHVKETLMPVEEWDTESWNGNIASDSDTENPDDYLGANGDQEKLQTRVKQRIIQIQQKAHREYAKRIAEKNFLARRRSTKVSGVLKTCPDIGKVIEQYVQDRSVGADAWRRTGVSTF